MNKRILLCAAIAMSAILGMHAQRATDKLDRGLVAMKSDDGVFCSWRINAEEWYDVAYNIYRDGTKLNDTPLTVSNFIDHEGTETSTYTVTAVVRGIEQPKSKAATVWASNYMEIAPKHDPSLTSTYEPNDACCADMDGDGELEILMKYNNISDAEASYPRDGHNGEYGIFECLKLDGTVMWWIDFGPNMADFQNNEQNIVGYDWDGDGRAEALLRAADGTKIHMADGTVYTVGDPSLNYRAATNGGTNWFMHHGKEYLLYIDGVTGKPYQCIDYPLPRLEEEENPNGLLSGSAYDNLVNQAWGDGYGHRSSKHFYGAPYLDGCHPSIFIARGIYTRHKMIAYDVDPNTHELVERWRWNCSTAGSPWYGQGYHNYSIADVDWDGRDEIVFGSMVIDDNGHGLSTTGLGHGDSHHVGDFDPYTQGQEVFACNEDNPNNNFRDATTSKIYYRTTGGNDDGRANCGNFIDEYPGAQGISSRDNNLIGGASHSGIDGDDKSTVTITQNFRIYWDGDLCDESFDYNNGKNSQGAIFKAKQGRIAVLEGSKTNNDTKGTPCYQGDLFGDWREEVMMRTADNKIRIFSTDIPTPWRNYTLWHDHQYRNAMVWQMCGYNQTPHVSYFLGEMEGITEAPAPITMTGRTEVANGATIGTEAAGKHLIMCETNDMSVNIASGATPYILTVNAPSWTQGHDNNDNITTETFTHTLTGGALTGEMRLVKQGDGHLILPAAAHTYTGKTEVWAGSLTLDGSLDNSPLWLNRFARLNTTGGKFAKGIDMHYGSVLEIGTDSQASTVTTDVLSLGFGAVVNIDLFSEGTEADKIVANVLKIEKKDWKNGPQYLQPIIRLTPHSETAALENGKYLIAEIENIEGKISDILIEGIHNQKVTPIYEDGKLYLDVKNFENALKVWNGNNSNIWDIDNAANFTVNDTQETAAFYPGDDLVFDDNADVTDIKIVGNLMPKSVTFNNEEKNYTLSGEGAIVGETSLVKNGAGKLSINNINQFTGGVRINGGTLEANSFANSIGTDFGALSSTNNRIYLSNGATLSASASTTMGQRVSISGNHGAISVPKNVRLTMQSGVTTTSPGQTLYKDNAGTLVLGTGNNVARLVIRSGSVEASENNNTIDLPKIVEFVNGSLYDPSNIYTYSTNPTNFVVAEGNKGSLYLDSRCNYTGTLTGAGSFTVYAAGPRNELSGDWSAFTGTLVASQEKRGSSYDPAFTWKSSKGLPNATLNITSSTTFDAGSTSISLGSLTGSGTINTTGTITVGENGKNFSFSGKYSGNPALIKTGSGDWKLTKEVSGLKSITVNDGTVSIKPSKLTTNVCEKTITLTGNALMRGRGTISSVSVQEGATLEPGSYTSSNGSHNGPIYIKGNATINEGGTLSLCIRKADNAENSRSHVHVDGKLTINGNIKVITVTYEPKASDEIIFWTAGSFEGTPSAIELPELPEGLSWDETGLKDGTGVLRVIESSGINDIVDDCIVICRVYTLDGILCGELEAVRSAVESSIAHELKLAPGIYVVNISAPGKQQTIKVNVK